jgi:DNA-directed RNA polymerase sigma subunit (sigma70/sigma32)
VLGIGQRKRLFDLADLLGISRVTIVAAYLKDRIQNNSKRWNLLQIPFASAKWLLWLRLIHGLTVYKVSKKTGISEERLRNFQNGALLLTKKELIHLFSLFELSDDDFKIINAAWESDQVDFVKKQKEKERKEQKRREERFYQLIKDVPRETLKPREWRILELRKKEGLTLAETAKVIAEEAGQKQSLSKERIRQLQKKAEVRITNWKKQKEESAG